MAEYNFALAALGAVATASDYVTSFDPVLAIDGSEATYWKYNFGLSSVWWKVDLGAPQVIHQLHVVPGPYQASSGNWTITYSTDDVTYYNLPITVPITTESAPTFDDITLRYLKFYRTTASNQYVSLKTVEVIGPVPAPPPPTGPAVPYLTDWLDGLEANYVDDAEDWLAAQ